MLSRPSRVQLFETLWAVARQAPLSMGFSRQDTGVGCHALLQGIFLNQGWNPHLVSAALAGSFFTASTTREAPRESNALPNGLKQEKLLPECVLMCRFSLEVSLLA